MADDPYAEFQTPAKTPSKAPPPSASGVDPYAEFQTPASSASPARDFGGNFVDAINPIPAVKKLATDPVGFGKGLVTAQTDQFKKAYADWNDPEIPSTWGRASSAAGHVAAGLLPFLGPAAAQAGEQIGSGDVAGGLGRAAGLLSSFAVPKLTKLGGDLTRAPAAPIAESALKIRNVDRAFHRAPGQAVLDHTNGFTLERIAQSAEQAIRDKTGKMESLIDASPNLTSLSPVRKISENAIQDAQARNAAGTIAQLRAVSDHVNKNAVTGAQLAAIQSPRGMLNLRRGLSDDHITTWNPDRQTGVSDTARSMYHGMNKELYSAVPDAKPYAEDIANLVPVKDRAAGTARHAGTMQQLLGKLTTPTGALGPAALAAGEGHMVGGPIGGLIGGLTGYVLPQLLGSPVAQMVAARTLSRTGKILQHPATGQVARGAAVSLIKSRNTQEQ